MKNVLILGDPGIDDSLALLYAILHPDINLVGVVACYGNINKEQAVKNVRYLLEMGNEKQVPVIRGAEGPLDGNFTVFYPEIHGPEGLGPIQPGIHTSTDFNSFNEIFEIVNQLEDDLIVVNLGRGTTLSVALICEPDIMKKVSAFYLMGGAFLVPGNVSPVAEANIHGDPIAAQNILTKAENTYLYPLNVTNAAYVTDETAKRIKRYGKNAYKDLIPKIIHYYIRAYKKMHPWIPGAPMHDVLTLAALTNPDLCQYVTKTVDVQIHGPAKGHTIADFRNPPDEQNGNPINIALQLNYNLFYQDFLTTMTRPLVKKNHSPLN
ncbi:nucleoside hydrolase [Pseudalkalibacillus sp. SCS-8]|uniref:nucleoside hydrolase n=1 Tax=Pseudalkalibacillus nanhaiensis TaxID=3115291 RepID=UPI0032DA61C0